MNLSDMILELANDDYVGLWELVWRGQTVAPDMELGALTAAIQDTARRLVEDGLLQMYEGVTFSAEERLVGPSDGQRFLDDASAWAAPSPSTPHVRVTTSEAGEKVYGSSTAG